MSDFLHEGYFILFAIIALGLMLGNARYKGFSLDSSAVIFVALLLGHLGFSIPEAFQKLGLLLFIFTIGIQAGPGFFEVFRRYGRQLIVIAFTLIASAAMLTYAAMLFFDLPADLAIGVFNGALTSTPGLAAAIEATGSAVTAVGYGIAYPVGVVGVILFVQLFPGLLRVNLKKEKEHYRDQLLEDHPGIVNKILKVTNQNIAGKSLRELDLRGMTGAVVSRVKQQGKTFAPNAKTVLQLGDLIKVVGNEDAISRMELLAGVSIDEDLSFDERYEVSWMLVTNKSSVNKSIRELNLTALNATITRIRRSGIDLTPHPHSRLRFGDKLLISGSSQEMVQVQKLLGNDARRLSETNFLPIALGIVLGIGVGAISIPIFGLFDFSLGLTGGVLAVALIMSNIGKTGPILWSMSGSGNQLLRRLGLLLFMATVGTNAGAEMAGVIEQDGFRLIGIGAAITLLPMFAAALVAHYAFKMNMLSLLGVLTGAMTSTPGLAAIDSKTETDAPSVAYAAVYPLALVLMILFSQLLSII
ncbi:MAG: transporter [Bacteroidetes bacterium]|nr:transporter [Bacteroidota bacterium]MBU1579462.1 transporter [Bacteroidota bacterium]MBU2466218.1 transporter [Bacteroidota bacterium]MBU2557972.1 transporter [Bacteroidota bacterium]